MIFSTLVPGRLLCGILRRNFSTSSVMAVNPGKLKYLGWDFPCIHLESSHISDEIVFVCIEYTQVYTIKVVVMVYISVCRIRYLDWDFPCLHKLWYLWWNCLCLHLVNSLTSIYIKMISRIWCLECNVLQMYVQKYHL